MTSPLNALRRNPQPTPSQFLAHQPGCFIQYFDDTPARDPAKALSARSFDPETARRKQRERCGVTFSLQVFGESRTKEQMHCYRNLGVDVDLISAAERASLSASEIDRRKDQYLTRRLLPFPLKPHWLIETRHGFHVLFRVQPQRTPESIGRAAALNRRLVPALGGDENAALLTQVLRVPGTLQFKNPTHPFLCRLLLDNSSTIAPYSLDIVRDTLAAWEVFQGLGAEQRGPKDAQPEGGDRPAGWRAGLSGVPEGYRNVTAAAIVGGVLGRLPEVLWETAGWGGLREWNRRNPVPLPDPELRGVFESIARRERAKRMAGRSTDEQRPASVLIQVNVRIGNGSSVSACEGATANDESTNHQSFVFRSLPC